MWLTSYLKTAGILLLSAGCGRGFHVQRTGSAHLPESAARVISAQNEFAFRLLDQVLARDSSGGNKLISPLSVYLDLSMAYNGTASSTRRAVATALGLQDISEDLLNTTSQGLLTRLPKEDPAVTLDMGNAIWYRDSGAQPLPGFVRTVRNDYQAEVTGAAFDDATVTLINDWVARKTSRKITSILDKIDPSDVMYLINVVYFKGQWRGAFDPGVTRPGAFHSPSGDVQVPFMAREARYNYLGSDSVQLIELPYGKGDFSMIVALPAAGIDFAQWIRALDQKRFATMVSAMDSSKVKLRLPKWQYAYQVDDLAGDLSRLGMGEAFSPRADFSAMYPPGESHCISKALHKTYIEVNEQGTEAAAVTSVGMSVTSMPLHPTPLMRVDRPFFYVIMEKKSRCILFLGVVDNPEET